jgi:hypothetical protein
MNEILTRCGYRCDLCLAYRPNIEVHPSNRQVLSDGWHKYFGFRIPPENIVCDGCMSENPQLIDKACPVRPCVIEKGLANCGHCPGYVCEKLTQRLVTYESVADRLGVPISEQDRSRFIVPYENFLRLERIREKIEE